MKIYTEEHKMKKTDQKKKKKSPSSQTCPLNTVLTISYSASRPSSSIQPIELYLLTTSGGPYSDLDLKHFEVHKTQLWC